MYSSLTVISVFCIYMGLLFMMALWAQVRSDTGRSVVNSPFIYSLSLAVYCTTWTYYGSVGSAANGGMLFLTVYLGPSLAMVFFWRIMGKMVVLKSRHHITSVADFLAARYGKSEGLAAWATFIILVGLVPYISLQLKAIFTTFAIITGPQDPTGGWIGAHLGPILVGLLVLFTIIFGVRRLDPTERHEGMVMVVVAESVVKLVVFLLVGVVVVFFFHDGPGPLFRGLEKSRLLPPEVFPAGGSVLTWITYLVLSANAVLLLPRQFHIAVVENQNPEHIRRAMWLFPLYMLLLNLFVFPIAGAGLLAGLPLEAADTFLLRLPLEKGFDFLALLVFLGGFSAGTSMILISSMTMSIMISNHLLLPLVDWIPALGFIERHLLKARWLAVLGFILLGYWFEQHVAETMMLVNIGIMSFAAMIQFAPAVFGGLFWRHGTRRGALAGLTAGFALWVYTLLMPTGGWLSPEVLANGPLGIGLLRPQQLFGLAGLDPVTHSVFWSLLFNLIFFVLGSLWESPDAEETRDAAAFVEALEDQSMVRPSAGRVAYISLAGKLAPIEELLTRYLVADKAREVLDNCLKALGITGKPRITITELAELCDRVERHLAGAIGSATAHRAVLQANIFDEHEAKELREVYAEILASLGARPLDLKRKIDFYQEREALIQAHSFELEDKIAELETQMAMRRQAESRLRESEERYRTAIEYSNDGMVLVKEDKLLFVNHKFAEIFGYGGREELVGREMAMVIHPDDRQRVTEFSRLRQLGLPSPSRYDFKGIRKDGTSIYIAASVTSIIYRGEPHNLAYMRDVTARRQAEEDIRHLSRRLIEGNEEERKRVAADLHDEFGQALTALHMGVESLQENLAPRGNHHERCQSLMGIIEGMADSIRRITTELRPDILDHLGLVATLEWYFDEYRQRVPGVRFFFQAVGFKRRVAPELEIVLYRILQEALNNVAKHARATQVKVILTYSHPRVIMMISDNGRGFDPAREPAVEGTGQGIGLIGMRERVASVGGTLDIRSQAGTGTTIRVTLTADPPPEGREPGGKSSGLIE